MWVTFRANEEINADPSLIAEHHTLYQYSLVSAQDHYMGLIQTETVCGICSLAPTCAHHSPIQPYYQPSPTPPTPFSLESSYNDPSFPSGQVAAWALNVQTSMDIIVFGTQVLHYLTSLVLNRDAGAGHYSFYQNYAQTCLPNSDCQSQIVNVDSGSSIFIYNLATIGVTNQLSVAGAAVIPASDNVDGLQSTFTVWTQ